MKTLLAVVICLLGLISISLGAFLQYLLLNKVQADPLMWFLFWFNIPMYLVILILNEVLKRIKEDM